MKSVETSNSLADELLSPSLASRIAQDFFTHSSHIPLTILILEALLSPPGYFLQPDGYLLLFAALVQSYFIGWRAHHGRPCPLLGNLVGPLLYGLIEFALERGKFFAQSQHLAYLAYGVFFALAQSLRGRVPRLGNLLLLLESTVRTTVPLVMYALFEFRNSGGQLSFAEFCADSAHVFLAIVLLLLGGLLGFAEISLRRHQLLLQTIARRLHDFSSWSIGSNIVAGAMKNPSALDQKRCERTVLFMDIRGFTQWSESREPEVVVGLLQDYYAVAEAALLVYQPIRVKFTADEVMAVFAEPDAALEAALAAVRAVQRVLLPKGLNIGAGLHAGPVIEGMLGSQTTRAYEVIGDTVNTASRVCSEAKLGELLCTDALSAPAVGDVPPYRDVIVKGKREPLRLRVLWTAVIDSIRAGGKA